jgi:hypothetical protein
LVEHTTENRGVPSSNLGLAIQKALQMHMFWIVIAIWLASVWVVAAQTAAQTLDNSALF